MNLYYLVGRRSSRIWSVYKKDETSPSSSNVPRPP
jgi:hypothetical protein